MNKFATLPREEKQIYLDKVKDALGLPADVVEKDYWVCLILRALYSIEILKGQLTFKGGTSLSKIYGLIKRFSEDIDISIEKTFLNYSGDKDPSNAQSVSKQKKLLDELTQALGGFIKNQLIGLLNERIKHEIGKELHLEIDSKDADGLTILCHYDPVNKNTTSYITPVVKIEMGARGEHWPISMELIQPYLADALGDLIQNAKFEVKVLKAERTFWEKATILHMYANCPKDKVIQARQSRHYYDLFCLINSDIKVKAQNDLALLKRVVEHKKLYFRATWANYDEAKKGSLKLIPSDSIKKYFGEDYKNMRNMFFAEPPAWDKILAGLEMFEKEFNKHS